jgi:hypothetical protein
MRVEELYDLAVGQLTLYIQQYSLVVVLFVSEYSTDADPYILNIDI